MSSHPTVFCAAQVVGLTGAAWLSGKIISLSTITVPAIVQSMQEDKLPSDAAVKLWRNVYNIGKSLAPPVAAATSTAFLYCAWAVQSSTTFAPLNPSNSSSLYCVAAALTLGIVPYTFGMMMGTNNMLMDLANSSQLVGEKSSVEVESLLSRWQKLNAGRGLLPLVGGLVALTAAIPWPLEMI
ncbi:hypothetical protein BDV26DRAFT_79573 [Aspergillus bertholletiae]|uniref:DUF1772-domain-containing protein n=1 Tax=Aspergillus bertholletiae TaxID=1226010 RepID=A0A5N7ASX9_9EURO|nr:hypothetical protein BDV26DRAFT_79573 [Aspergillus bertholletiae]